jgi:long-chain fatty acid transport protein
VDQEVLTETHVSDWFVPRGTFSVVGKPMESLELMAQLTVTADIVADGHLDARANGIHGAPRGNCRSGDPGTHCRIDDVTLRVPFQRVELYLGARYAHLRPGEGGARPDPMRDEVWDVELDLYFAQTAHVDAFRLQLYDVPPSAPNAARIDFTSDPSGSPSPLPPDAVIPKEWSNTYGVRIGGDYNVLPGLLSVRAGLSYESRAAPLSYMNIDYWPINKVGIHFGATVAVGIARLSIAYAHLFYEQRTVPVGTGRVPEIVALNRDEAQAVNEGSYSARADIISLQANLRF